MERSRSRTRRWTCANTTYHSWLHSTVGGTPVFGRRTDPVLRSTFSWLVTTMWVNRPLQVSQLGQLSLSSSQGRQMSSELQVDVRQLNWSRRHLVNAYEVKAGVVFIAIKTVWSMPECFKVVCIPCKALYKWFALHHSGYAMNHRLGGIPTYETV